MPQKTDSAANALDDFTEPAEEFGSEAFLKLDVLGLTLRCYSSLDKTGQFFRLRTARQASGSLQARLYCRPKCAVLVGVRFRSSVSCVPNKTPQRKL